MASRRSATSFLQRAHIQGYVLLHFDHIECKDCQHEKKPSARGQLCFPSAPAGRALGQLVLAHIINAVLWAEWSGNSSTECDGSNSQVWLLTAMTAS